MVWPHDLKIERSGDAPGTQDANSGAWEPGVDAPIVVYDGRGDLQHKTRQLRKSNDRDTLIQSEADLFLADERDLWTLRTHDRVTIVDVKAQVEITGKLVDVDHLSGKAFVADLVVTPLTRVTADDAAIRVTGADEERTTS